MKKKIFLLIFMVMGMLLFNGCGKTLQVEEEDAGVQAEENPEIAENQQITENQQVTEALQTEIENNQATESKEQNKQSDGKEKESTEKQQDENQVSYTGKIIERREESFLIASDTTQGLMDVNVSAAGLTENGEAVTMDQIAPGAVVEVIFDGLVLETYPGQIAASHIEVKSREDDLVGLYTDILKQVYENDSGLNGSIIAVDLSKAENLSKGEKEAVLYEAWMEFGTEVISGTYEQLKEQGYISEDGLYFKDGVLLSIETLEIGTDSFTFSASKWSSGDGADFYTDCTAEKKDGKYSFQLGGFAIS